MPLKHSGCIPALIALLWSLLPAHWLGAAPIEKNFLFFVEIEDRFSPTYLILGPAGGELPNGQIALNARQCLHTIKPIPVSLWRVTPDGSSRSPVPAFRMKWTQVSAEYRGGDTSNSEPIPAALVKVTVDHQDTPVGTSFELSSSLLGYNQVAVHSDEPLPAPSPGNISLVVQLAGVFENVID